MRHAVRALSVGLGLWAAQYGLAWLSPSVPPASLWATAAPLVALTPLALLAALWQFEARRPSMRLALRVGFLWLTLAVIGNLAVQRWDLGSMAAQDYLARNAAAPLAFVVGPLLLAFTPWPRWRASAATTHVPAKLGR